MARKKRPRPEPESLGLPCVGVDTHAHLDLKDFGLDLELVLSRARRSGVKRIGNVFMGPEAYFENRKLFAQHQEVFFLAGVHPHDAGPCSYLDLERLSTAICQDKRLVAWGEIGLDFYYRHSDPEVQLKVFKQQLELARDLDLPVVIHSRQAEAQTMQALLDMGFADRPLLWHCFGQGPEFGHQLLKKGWLISIPGTVSFKKNFPLQEAVRSLPLEALLLETDAPFLAPEPYRGKRNEPAFTAFTAQAVGELKGLPVSRIWRQTGQNAERFFSIT